MPSGISIYADDRLSLRDRRIVERRFRWEGSTAPRLRKKCRWDRTSDDPGIVRLQLHRATPPDPRTCLFADENPLVLRHDTEIDLPVGEDRDDPSPDLHKQRVGR